MAVTVRQRNAEASPAASDPPAAPAGPERPIQLPPLSFPKGGPPRKVSGTKPPTRAACAPRVEVTSDRSRPVTGG